MKNTRTHSFSLAAILITAAMVTAFPLASPAAELMELPDGPKLDLTQKCPVCGMIIGGKDGQGVTVTYKDGRAAGFAGVAAAVFKDGHVVGFEGARCLFIYNSVPEKYSISVATIARQYVTDFLSKKMIELPKAFLVLGSNVKGPMGYELVAFSSVQEASKFASENDGKWIVQLHEVGRGGQDSAKPEAPGETQPRPAVSSPAKKEGDTAAPGEPPAAQTKVPDQIQTESAPPKKEPRRYPESQRPPSHHGGGHHGH